MNIILDLLFPKKCVGCRKTGTYFCVDCVANILQTDLVCPMCERLAMGGQTHPICKKRFGLDGLWSLGIYSPRWSSGPASTRLGEAGEAGQDSLRVAIKQLKYRKIPELAGVLVDILVEYWARYQPFVFDQIKRDQAVGWVVIPVPIHWWRENSRGFNQSSLIGQSLSKKLGLAYCDGLKRIKYTKPQAELKGKQRQQNIRGAFETSSDYQLQATNYVLLIDDVWTTGSTLKECCYVLKQAGAKKVWALTLAR